MVPSSLPTVALMQPTLVARPFHRAGWVYEEKYEGAIVQGVVGKTTAALLQNREGRRDALHARLRALTDRPTVSPLRVGPAEIQARLERLDELLKLDSTRVNRVFRQIIEPVTMTPGEEKGRGFYRATGAAKGAEMLNRLGLAQAVDFGGCGPPI